MVASVAKALRLLETLKGAGVAGVSLGELASQAGLKPPTTHNLLQTLVQLDYATHDPGTRRYALGPRAVTLARPLNPDAILVRSAGPVLQELRDELKETVILAQYRDGMRHTLLTVESREELRVGAGASVDDRLYSTATGRVLLSRLPARELRCFVAAAGLPGLEWPETRDLAQLRRALERIREARFATYVPPEGHIRAAAVPILSARDDVRAAVGVHYPRVRQPAGSDQALRRILTQAAVRIAIDFESVAGLGACRATT